MLIKKIFILIFLTIIGFIQAPITLAENTEELNSLFKNYTLPAQEHLSVGNTLSFDISDLKEQIKTQFPNLKIQYEWVSNNQENQSGTNIDILFEKPGNKTIQLNIYSETENIKTLLHSFDISTFVYSKNIPLLISTDISGEKLTQFIQDSKDQGTYVHIIGPYKENELQGKKIIEQFHEYSSLFSEQSNYFSIWGEKEFLFSVINQIAIAEKKDNTFNFVLISSYNTSILQNYINNNIAGKNFIDTAFIIDESLSFQILKNPEKIENLQAEVEKNNYRYTPLSQDVQISQYLFASQFINQLSNQGISISDIYIILLLPIFLTCVGIAKHMVGISTLGSIIPLFITLLFIKIGIGFTLGILAFFLIFNIIIARFVSKYTLLYTPKVTCITILNLLGFMLVLQVLHFFNIMHIPLDNILYVVLFFILAEKIISIITTKEFREYRKSISGTIIVSVLCYMIYNFDTFRVMLMAYPEILLIFVPLNFFLGRFTGLRITEYLRFREIIKTEEEE